MPCAVIDGSNRVISCRFVRCLNPRSVILVPPEPQSFQSTKLAEVFQAFVSDVQFFQAQAVHGWLIQQTLQSDVCNLSVTRIQIGETR